jgi:hypothetical protein
VLATLGEPSVSHVSPGFIGKLVVVRSACALAESLLRASAAEFSNAIKNVRNVFLTKVGVVTPRSLR